MARDFARSFYKSKAWQDTRESYISKRQSVDGGLCEVCCMSVGTIVHHIEHLTPENINDPHIALGHDNLELNCHDCHNQQEGHGFQRAELPCSFDADGNPIPPIKPCK